MFKCILETDDLMHKKIEDLFKALEPDNAIERIQFRRNVGNAISGKKDFVVVKGQVG